jgi:hypothetical protein
MNHGELQIADAADETRREIVPWSSNAFVLRGPSDPGARVNV